MNSRRLFVLLLAAGAAGVVALMVRGIIGGGTKQADAKAAPAPVEVTQVLVAAQRIEPGQPLNAAQVRWQAWPVKGMDPAFIRQTPGLGVASVVEGTVARAPIVEGEPVTFAKIVKSQGSGYMAATLAPGMRAVSIGVSVASVAGGFIQPNDRVDLMVTVMSGDRHAVTKTVLSNVRVLAIDQASDSKNKAVSDVKTVTLELTPEQARNTALAQALGTLSLALRSLGDTDTADDEDGKAKSNKNNGDGVVAVLRYGIIRKAASGGGQ